MMQTNTETKPSEELQALQKKEYKLLFLEVSLLLLLFSAESLTSGRVSAQLENFDRLSANEADLITNLTFIFLLLMLEVVFRYQNSKLSQQRIDGSTKELKKTVDGQAEQIAALQKIETRVGVLEQNLAKQTH